MVRVCVNGVGLLLRDDLETDGHLLGLTCVRVGRGLYGETGLQRDLLRLCSVQGESHEHTALQEAEPLLPGRGLVGPYPQVPPAVYPVQLEHVGAEYVAQLAEPQVHFASGGRGECVDGRLERDEFEHVGELPVLRLGEVFGLPH